MTRRARYPRPGSSAPCPCGRGLPFGECCGPFLAGGDAPTPEQLMRSRYTAFVVGDDGYLRRTWHPGTRPARLDLDPAQRWTGLEVLHTSGGFLHSEGTVEFRAHYCFGGHEDVLHEHSRFVREGGHWYYVEALGRP
ncbi:YchJ family protein [Rhodococcus ruber]|nr:YchJ family metal-binding protein [Rhodococcus ruber]